MREDLDRPIRVMLVDDHKCVLWGLEKLINSEQPRMNVVGKAHSRAEALATVRACCPHIVLLDLDLNGERSLDFLPELIAQNNVQVLILTGLKDNEAREEAMLRGASGVVLKDQPVDVLLKAIECVNRGEIWLDRLTTGKVFSAFLKGNNSHNPEAEKIATLTPKEREIVAAVVVERGAKSFTIAERLHMSDHTLRNHLTSIYSKLQVKNRVELVMYATENKLSKSLSAMA